MNGNSNANSRAIVGALKSDLTPLRAAAVTLIDRAVFGAEKPRVAVMLAFGCEQRTADTILQLRTAVTKSGRAKR